MFTLALLGQSAFAASIGGWLIAALVVAGIIGIFLVVVHAAKIPIPGWFIQILWIVLAVVVGAVAIRYLMTLL